jgi:hypothetical protein
VQFCKNNKESHLLNNENEPGGSHLIIENIKVIDMNGISQK